MRAKIAYIMLLFLFIGGDSASEHSDATKQSEVNKDRFHLEAAVVEALEGGPLVIKATLRYEGEQPIKVYQMCNYSNVSMHTPQEWRFDYEAIQIYNGPLDRIIEMNKGEELTETLSLHQFYSNIQRGVADIRLTWHLMDPKEEDHCLKEPSHTLYIQDESGYPWKIRAHQILSEPSTTLHVTIPPADGAHLATLCERFGDRLNRSDFREKDWSELLNELWGTKHPALVSVVCRMMSSCPINYPVDHLLDLCYKMDESPGHAADTYLIQAVNSGACRWAPLAFSRWREEKKVLPHAMFHKLTHGSRPSTKVLTYVTFPDRCDKVWIATLLKELTELRSPIPQSRFVALLRGLDDDDFVAREAASTSLEQFGVRVESQLHQALQTHLSPEAKGRVQLILERIAISKESPEWKPIIEYLYSGDCDRDAAVAVLRSLAKGNPDAALTKAAVASLHKLTAPK